MRQEEVTPTQQGGRNTRATSEQAEASKGTAVDAGNENWEPCRQRLVRTEIGQKTCGKPEGLSYVATERVGEDTCETWDCMRRSVAGHVASYG